MSSPLQFNPATAPPAGNPRPASDLNPNTSKFNACSIWSRPYLSPLVKTANIVSSSLAFAPQVVSGYASTISGVSSLFAYWIEHADREKERIEISKLENEYKELERKYEAILSPPTPPNGYGVKNSWSTCRIVSVVASVTCTALANSYLAYTGFVHNYENDKFRILSLTVNVLGTVLHNLDEHLKKNSIQKQQDYYRKLIDDAKDKIIKHQAEELRKEKDRAAANQPSEEKSILPSASSLAASLASSVLRGPSRDTEPGVVRVHHDNLPQSRSDHHLSFQRT